MRVRQSWLVLGMLLVPTAVRADDHRADVFGAFSYAQGSTLLGFHQSGALLVPKLKSKDLTVVVGDLSVHFGSRDGNDVTRVNLLSGLRWTFAWKESQKHVFFAQGLGGVVYTNNGADNPKDEALAVGGGWEHLPARTKDKEGLGIRVQVDYIVRPGDADNFLRVSAGVLYRFKQ